MEDIMDVILEAGKDPAKLKPHVLDMLDVLMAKENMEDRNVYKVMAAVVSLIQDDLLENNGEDVFFTCVTLFDMSNETASNEDAIKRTMDEIANALFSNACSALLSRNSPLIVEFVPHILSVMKRNEKARLAGYACVAPLLHNNIKAFTDAVEPLLQMIPHFTREVLSVIDELYRLQPRVFDENIPLLIQLCDSTPTSQSSILHILYEIGQRDDTIVEPHLVKLCELCELSGDSDIEEMKAFFEGKLRMVKEKASPSPVIVPPAASPALSPVLNQNEAEQAADEATLSGALRKRGRMFGRMVSRWFTLEDGSLNFFKSPKKAEPSRRLSLADVVRVTSDAEHPHAFVVRTRKRSVLFSAGSDKEKEQWMSAIEKHAQK